MEKKVRARAGSLEAKDRFAAAPPGHSLTEDNSKWAWGRPPQIVDPEIALEKAITSLQRPKVRDEMFKLLFTGISVEVILEGYILQAFQEGKFTVDVGLLIKGPLGLYLSHMAEKAGIPYRLFENEDAGKEGTMDDTTFFRMMKDNNPRMFEFIRENINESIREGNTPSEPKEENFLTMDASQETSPEEEVETPPQEMRERPPEEMGDPEEMAMEQIPTEEEATV
jgi:hypothetical protein|tara:strand:+ start:451 stop:1125 length:675 start_codon:yes stop_codon:yes gene_type:complete